MTSDDSFQAMMAERYAIVAKLTELNSAHLSREGRRAGVEFEMERCRENIAAAPTSELKAQLAELEREHREVIAQARRIEAEREALIQQLGRHRQPPERPSWRYADMTADTAKPSPEALAEQELKNAFLQKTGRPVAGNDRRSWRGLHHGRADTGGKIYRGEEGEAGGWGWEVSGVNDPAWRTHKAEDGDD